MGGAAEALSAALTSPDFPLIAAACLLAGIVRGFSGFGTALVFMPLATSAVPPAVALAALMIFDNAGGLSLLPWGLRRWQPRQVVWMFLGVVLGVPLGVALLAAMSPEPLRWLICLLALAGGLALASGWRWRGRIEGAATIPVGLASGVMGGVAGLSGVPVVLFYLGVGAAAERMRANIIVLFMAASVIAIVNLAWQGLFTAQAVALGVVLAPVFLIGALIGRRLFPLASETIFRRMAYGLIFASVLVGLPLWR